ncbi:hypothetical protein B0J13DRAFT_151848 [Dactylonectria estremocensis]|uniref:RBR-type E3 ubiquitin transferase n=1 Tax=Dactylonectria estremocensis TaxID=1079267 RepID=A0A9P9DM51_9HYPO|nr:hypothetical protein B0J13DRAFT_151848 [Dactylonectria estremocensis]
MGNLFSAQAPEPPRQLPRQAVDDLWGPAPVYRQTANEARVPAREHQHRATVLNDVPTIRTPCGPCQLFGRRTCSRDGACQFAIRSLTHPAPSWQSRKPCHFFARGHCKKGDACGFSHDAASRKEMEGGLYDNTDDEPIEDWTRELGGAWVQFSDGATTIKVSLPSDFSAIRISNLPTSSSVADVLGLLSDVSLVISADAVRLMTPPDLSNCTAIVKVEDPKFAKAACTRLATCITLKGVKVISIPVPIPANSNFHQVDCRQVHCSWHRPTRTASLTFGSKPIADQAFHKFSTGKSKVLGSKVTANRPIAQQHDQQGGKTWLVKLTGLPEITEEDNITQAIPTSCRPRQIEMGELNYITDMEVDSTLIMSMLYEFGPLERWQVSNSSQGKRVKAHAVFFEEPHARDAASSLDRRPLPFCQAGKLFAQLITTVRFKVSTRVYEVVKNRIELQKKEWEGQYIRFFAFPPKSFSRILKLEGEDRQLVAQAQSDLEKIVAGQVLVKEGKKLWHADYRISGFEYKKLKKIERNLGVVIIRDVRSSQFRIFGPEENYTQAADALHKLIEDVTSKSHSIILESVDEFRWAVGGGFDVLNAQLGQDKAVFDISLRRIVVRGSGEDFALAKLILARRQTEPIKKIYNALTDCPICMCEAEEPVRTSCNHVYCGLCFVNMCQAEASGPGEFRITCKGNSGSCEKPLHLIEMQQILLAETFEEVLQASFASYVRQHPGQFRYCSTPDCSQIYRVISGAAAIPTTFTCGKCLASMCRSCHVSHAGKTCAEQKGDESGGHEALARVKKELGIKDCPECGTSIEKTEGCNHMACKLGCGTHICWICLATFREERLCYQHLQKLHGGSGN